MSTISPEVEHYLDSVSEDRKATFTELYHTIDRALPEGSHLYQLQDACWVVPHSLYPPIPCHTKATATVHQHCIAEKPHRTLSYGYLCQL